jgi:hypothetical protein
MLKSGFKLTLAGIIGGLFSFALFHFSDYENKQETASQFTNKK